MSKIFAQTVDFNKNELQQMLLGNEITFPTLVAGDAGYTFYHSVNKLPYLWDGTNWIGLGGAGNDVWRKSDLITAATTYTEQIHHNGNVILNGVAKDSGYSNAFGSTKISSIGINGNRVETDGITTWMEVRGNQGIRIQQINQNVGWVQLGNDSLGTMSGNQNNDRNVRASRPFTASSSQNSDPNWVNLYLNCNVNYSASTAGTNTFTSLHISPTLNAVDVHYGVRGSGIMQFTDYGSGTITDTKTYNTAFNTNGRLIEIPLGEVKTSLRQVSTADTVAVTDHIVEATTGTFTITLPTAVGITAQEFIIKNSGSGTITVDGDGSETIDGNATVALSQYDTLTVVSNGTNFIITSNA